MSDPKHADPKDLEIAKLKAELSAAKVKPGADRLVLAEEHKGTKSYVVGPSKHYRNGKMYEAGEVVTVTDERPAKDWVLADKGEAKVAKAAVVPTGRASDKSVGG